MSSYVPPGKRKKNDIRRRKALVIPMIGNKYIVARNRKSKNITFIGGGCKNAQNNKKCALQELNEEARHSIQNKNLINFFNFVAEPRYRLLNGYNNKGQQISTDYKVFSLKPTKSFKNIYNNFHKSVPIKNSPQNEMSNIMLMSLNNLKKNKVYTVMKNKVLPRLKERKSRW